MVASSELPEQTLVVADEAVERQGVVVRQDGGEIDAGIQTQLERLREMLS